jgi:hypothetical protein
MAKPFSSQARGVYTMPPAIAQESFYAIVDWLKVQPTAIIDLEDQMRQCAEDCIDGFFACNTNLQGGPGNLLSITSSQDTPAARAAICKCMQQPLSFLDAHASIFLRFLQEYGLFLSTDDFKAILLEEKMALVVPMKKSMYKEYTLPQFFAKYQATTNDTYFYDNQEEDVIFGLEVTSKEKQDQMVADIALYKSLNLDAIDDAIDDAEEAGESFDYHAAMINCTYEATQAKEAKEAKEAKKTKQAKKTKKTKDSKTPRVELSQEQYEELCEFFSWR